MLGNGEGEKKAIRPDFNKSIFIDFAGAKLTSDAGFLLMREVEQRFGIIESGCSRLMDKRSVPHKMHTYGQMIRQRVYPIGAGYTDGNDADFLRIDSALRLALDEGDNFGASQSVMLRLENDVLGTAAGEEALDAMITRSTDVLLKWRNKRRLILDLDSTVWRPYQQCLELFYALFLPSNHGKDFENREKGVRNLFSRRLPHNLCLGKDSEGRGT